MTLVRCLDEDEHQFAQRPHAQALSVPSKLGIGHPEARRLRLPIDQFFRLLDDVSET